MSRQRLLIIAVPALVVGFIELVSDTLLDPLLPFPRDALLVTLAAALLAAGLSGIAERRIQALDRALAARNRELEERAASAAALRRVSVAITALVDLQQVLDAVVGHARELLRTDAAILFLAADDGRLRVAASSALPDATEPGVQLATGEDDPLFAVVRPAFRVSRLVAPLQHGSETIGQLAVAARAVRAFDVDDVETLASLADQAAIAIEHARMQERLRDTAVVSERERIAREMHDGLAQVLGYVNTKSQAVEQLLAAGRVDDAREQMRELSIAARSLYVDVREAILGLRSPISPGLGLVGAIEDYAARFADASKIRVVVEASEAARRSSLEPATGAEVFRIVQEGLTNVRKHAGAGRVVIRIERAGDELQVDLVDDGRGLAGEPPRDEGWPHYGVPAMRERAAAVGGTVSWEDAPGGGACVRVRVPATGRLEAVAS